MKVQRHGVLFLLMLCSPLAAQAQGVFWFPNGVQGLGRGIGGNTQTNGYSFSVNEPTLITAVGWFDRNSDGLTHEHELGIWNSDGQLLVDETVPAGMSAPLNDGFRYQSIPAPLILPPGVYIVGG